MKSVAGYSILGLSLVALAVLVSVSALLWTVALVVSVWGLVRAAGWRLPEDVVRPTEPADHLPQIPTLIGKPKITGAWTETGPGELPGSGWWVYRQYDEDGELVYGGQTNNLERRFQQHWATGKAAEEGWVTWEAFECTGEEEMLELEKLIVLYNKPKTNIERWKWQRYLSDRDELEDAA